MKKNAIVFLYCLSTIACAYSQTVYPRAIRSEDGKTIVEITVTQMDSVLSAYDQLDESRALVVSLEEEIMDCREVVAIHERKDTLAVADSLKQAQLVGEYVGKVDTLEKANRKLQRKGKAVAVVVYVSSALAAAFAILAAVK